MASLDLNELKGYHGVGQWWTKQEPFLPYWLIANLSFNVSFDSNNEVRGLTWEEVAGKKNDTLQVLYTLSHFVVFGTGQLYLYSSRLLLWKKQCEM